MDIGKTIFVLNFNFSFFMPLFTYIDVYMQYTSLASMLDRLQYTLFSTYKCSH